MPVILRSRTSCYCHAGRPMVGGEPRQARLGSCQQLTQTPFICTHPGHEASRQHAGYASFDAPHGRCQQCPSFIHSLATVTPPLSPPFHSGSIRAATVKHLTRELFKGIWHLVRDFAVGPPPYLSARRVRLAADRADDGRMIVDTAQYFPTTFGLNALVTYIMR